MILQKKKKDQKKRRTKFQFGPFKREDIMDIKKVSVIGAGLAGCEASYQLAKRGIEVDLYDIKPTKFTPAHSSPNFAEIVCSNSLKSTDTSTASGLLKKELEKFDSLILKTK